MNKFTSCIAIRPSNSAFSGIATSLCLLSMVTVSSIASAAPEAEGSEVSKSEFSQFNSDYCDVNINADLKLEKNTLTVTSESGQVLVINPDYNLTIDGQVINLSASQKKLTKNYYDNIYSTIPQAMTVASEGVKVANTVVPELMRGFLGEQSKAATMLEAKLNTLHQDLKLHVNQNPSYISFDTQYIKEDLGLDTGIEEEIDLLVEEIVEQATGEFMVQMSKSFFSAFNTQAEDSVESDKTGVSSFEQRMEKMGEELEVKIEENTKTLELEMNKLCDMLEDIDASENKMQNIEGLSNLDLIQFNGKS